MSARPGVVAAALALVLSSLPTTAQAIPAFARRYGTSCLTCHTVYPKLTPFGEAFRRNGFKFPGKDEDFVKQETVPLGNDAYKALFPRAVWPAQLPASVPLAFGGNGSVMIHPDTHSGAAVADNNSVVSLHDLVAEAHLWAGGALTEHIAYFAEVTFATDSSLDVEHLELHFNDLFGPKHLFNLYVGKGSPTLTSFGPHSSYVSDALLTGLSTTALYGGTSDSFNLLDHYNLIELNGMAKGRFIYSIGINSGANMDVRNTENAYLHLGFKLGGMRLDGEGDTAGNPGKPWAENALTVDVFGYRSASVFQPASGTLTLPGMTATPIHDLTWVIGGHLRGQLSSFELNSGFYYESHDHATADGQPVHAMVQYNELSYVVFPWLVPALRIEWAGLQVPGTKMINDVKITPGIVALVTPNLKLSLVGQIEWADGAPPGGWAAGSYGGSAAPTAMMGSVTEFESIQIGLAYAF